MPYRDSEYPSILRGRDKRESQRLMAAAPELLAALKEIVAYDEGSNDPEDYGYEVLMRCKAAIAKAEGRE
jgi:hypothetical protein